MLFLHNIRVTECALSAFKSMFGTTYVWLILKYLYTYFIVLFVGVVLVVSVVLVVAVVLVVLSCAGCVSCTCWSCTGWWSCAGCVSCTCCWSTTDPNH